MVKYYARVVVNSLAPKFDSYGLKKMSILFVCIIDKQNKKWMDPVCIEINQQKISKVWVLEVI